MSNSVGISHVSKRYTISSVQALQEISLHIESGELFGIIGPDGAGKTTLFQILSTLLLPDTGQATVCGYDAVKDYKAIRKIVGYMPGRFSLYQDLSVDENLHFFATVFNTTVEENKHLIHDIYVQLEPFKARRAGKLSGGMKQKLALCCALVHQPRVLFLDEPTTGVDPVSRKEFWDMLYTLKQKGITIIVSTAYMDEAARCDRIALIQKGQILDVDTYAGILQKHQRPILAVRAESMYRLLQDLRQYDNCETCYTFGSVHHVLLKSHSTASLDALLRFLQEKEHRNPQIREIPMDIEDIFIGLMANVA